MNKKFIGLIAVLLMCIGALAFNTYSKRKNLDKNSVYTKAVIEKITNNKFDNELTPSVENIHIKYKYIIDSNEFIKTQEIPKHEHDLYFSETGKVGDSVNIIYDAKNPTNSKMKKIK